MPYRNGTLIHRFLLHPMIYSQQEVWAYEFDYQHYKLAVASTEDLRFFKFTEIKYDWVCFERSTGFPVSYGETQDVAIARAKAALYCEEVDPKIDAFKKQYGTANATTQLLERG